MVFDLIRLQVIEPERVSSTFFLEVVLMHEWCLVNPEAEVRKLSISTLYIHHGHPLPV
jgi:hypothetical protein